MEASHHFRAKPGAMAVGLALGLVLGLGANLITKTLGAGPDAPWWLSEASVAWITDQIIEPIGRVFLRLILCVVLPLVFSALVLAVVEFRDLGQLGRLGLRAIGLTALLSAISVVLGLLFVQIFAPGKFFSADVRDKLRNQYEVVATENNRTSKSVSQVLLDLIPENPLQEAVGALDGSAKGNGMLAIMVFALLIGSAAISVGTKTSSFLAVLEGLFAISMKIVDWAMRIAPLGVACLMFSAGARMGLDLLGPLLGFLGVVLAGLALHMFGVYPALLMVHGTSPRQFFGGIGPVILTAFGTASSNVTLPTALQAAEENLGIPRQIARFVLTVGATGNQNGTALYEGVVILFLAQVFGVELTFWQQVTVLLFAILAGVGTAGIPAGSIPMIMAILAGIGVPPESVGLILGFDRFLDMCRTVVNVTGDLTIAKCLAAHHPSPTDQAAP